MATKVHVAMTEFQVSLIGWDGRSDVPQPTKQFKGGCIYDLTPEEAGLLLHTAGTVAAVNAAWNCRMAGARLKRQVEAAIEKAKAIDSQGKPANGSPGPRSVSSLFRF